MAFIRSFLAVGIDALRLERGAYRKRECAEPVQVWLV